MAARHEVQVRNTSDSVSPLQKNQSPRHKRMDQHSTAVHQRKLQRQRSRDSGGWESGPLNSSSPSTMADYFSGGGGSRVTRTAGITGLLTVNEQSGPQRQDPPLLPPISPGTSVSAGSQRASHRQSPSATVGATLNNYSASASPRSVGRIHKGQSRDRTPSKSTVNASATATSTEGG